jgi:PAS domain S-box-containing protein
MLRIFSRQDKWGKRNLEKLFHSLNEGITVQDKSGKIVYANEAAARLVGMKTTESLINSTPGNIVKKFKVFDNDNKVFPVNKFPSTLVFERKQTTPVVLRFYNVRTKQDRWAEVDASPFYGSDGEVVYAINIFRDITDKKQKEEELSFRNQLLHAQGEATTQGILAVDKKQNVIYVNSRLSQILNVSLERLEGRTVTDLFRIGNESISDFQKFILKALVVGRSKTRKAKGVLNMKSGKIVSYYTVPVTDEKDTFISRLWFFEDKTSEFKLEKQREAFIGMVTHELRNPLTTVRGYAEIIKSKSEKNQLDKIDDYAARIIEQTDKVTELVGDLLDLTQIRSGALKLKKEDFDLNQLINSVVEDYKRTTTNKFYKAGIAKKPVYADRGRIRQVIVNLISNAIKYSPANSVITISVKQSSETTSVSVKDVGFGISENDKQKIFEIYVRGKKNSNRAPGFGIGLFVSQSIIKGHGGKLLMDSKVGKGSTFTFVIPHNKNLKEKINLFLS